MALFIVGGSNSIFRDGWVAKLPGARNLSVGANTTLCGIFRCLLDDGPKGGDTIIWEYGVNEIVHGRALYAAETILRNLEHFLRLAHCRDWKVLPLMLIPRDEERDGLPAYYHSALQLFRHYGLTVVDANAAFRQKLGRIPAAFYKDPVHYRLDPEVTGRIGRMALDHLDLATCPVDASPIQAEGTIEIVKLRYSSIFINSIMSVPLVSMPIRLRMDGRGVIRSIVTLCRPGISSGIRARLSRNGKALANSRISTTCRVDKTLLKALSMDSVGDWSFRDGDVLSLRYINTGGLLYAEQGLRKRVQDVIIPDLDTLAGVLLERR